MCSTQIPNRNTDLATFFSLLTKNIHYIMRGGFMVVNNTLKLNYWNYLTHIIPQYYTTVLLQS